MTTDPNLAVTDSAALLNAVRGVNPDHLRSSCSTSGLAR